MDLSREVSQMEVLVEAFHLKMIYREKSAETIVGKKFLLLEEACSTPTEEGSLSARNKIDNVP